MNNNADTDTQSAYPGPGYFGPIEIVSLGLKVWLSEIKWVMLDFLRNREITQLKKRLDQELISLGKTRIEDTAAADEALDLAKKQVEFLEAEIAHLTGERDELRRNMIRKRMQSWGLAPRSET